MKISQAILDVHAQFGGDLELMQKAYEYDDLKDEITTLRSSLSTARSEGIREGLEMAAKVADKHGTECLAKLHRKRSDHDLAVFESAASEAQSIAATIRAKIEEVKP